MKYPGILRHRIFVILILVGILLIGMHHPLVSSMTHASSLRHAEVVSVAIAETRTTPETLPTASMLHNEETEDSPTAIVISELPLSAMITSHARLYQVSAQEEWGSIPTVSSLNLLRATEIPIPPATPTLPAFVMTANGPVGCPVQPVVGQVVLTQGYGVGTHTPASQLGAVDLGVDTDGDGIAEPSASFGALVVASHSGTAQVITGSWPGGDMVSVSAVDSGWRTNYAHLSEILVQNGAYVEAGTPIGLIGSTGMTSGPHLDYQVWSGGTNRDPTTLVEGCHR